MKCCLELTHGVKDVGRAECDHVGRENDTNVDTGWIVNTRGDMVELGTPTMHALEEALEDRNGQFAAKKPLELIKGDSKSPGESKANGASRDALRAIST